MTLLLVPILRFIYFWALLFVRHARTQYRKARFLDFLRAAPAVAVLLVAWTSGEACGYLTKEA